MADKNCSCIMLSFSKLIIITERWREGSTKWDCIDESDKLIILRTKISEIFHEQTVFIVMLSGIEGKVPITSSCFITLV